MEGMASVEEMMRASRDLANTVNAGRGLVPPALTPQKQGFVSIGPNKDIHYKLYDNTPLRHQQPKAPLVIIHGGPGLSHEYMLSLAPLASTRPVVFFDQYGVGSSAAFAQGEAYTLKDAIRDAIAAMDALLSTLFPPQTRYHLLGHSFGGMIAFEHLVAIKARGSDLVASVTLISTPSRAADAVAAQTTLMAKCDSGDEFSSRHFCRVERPKSLVVSEASAFSGLDAILLWEAGVPRIRNAGAVPFLLLSGEHDYIGEGEMKPWSLLPSLAVRRLSGCSHCCMIEDAGATMSAVEEHLAASEAPRSEA